MKEILDSFTEEKIKELLLIGEIKVDNKGVCYLYIDLETYLNSNI